MTIAQQIKEMSLIFDSGCYDIPDHICKIRSNNCSVCKAIQLYQSGYRKQSKGEWHKRTFIMMDMTKEGYTCSNCNTTSDTPTNYCPQCGAKMIGGVS